MTTLALIQALDRTGVVIVTSDTALHWHDVLDFAVIDNPALTRAIFERCLTVFGMAWGAWDEQAAIEAFRQACGEAALDLLTTKAQEDGEYTNG